MDFPGLGPLTPDTDWLRSAPLPLPVLGAAYGQVILSGYAGDPAPEDFHRAVHDFLALDRDALNAVSADVLAHHRAARADGDVRIENERDVWAHVELGTEALVERAADGQVYVSVECECAWEPEHGMVIVFRHGRTVSRIGRYDGQVLSDAVTVPQRADQVISGVIGCSGGAAG